MQSVGMTDVGISRQVNQDYIFTSDTTVGILPNLYIVADGMGGHNAGDFASRFCVEHFSEYLKEIKEKPVSYISCIEEGIKRTNEQLIIAAAQKPEYDGMGTTFVLATVDENAVMNVANVGDSRLYRINKAGIRQITEDHSLVAEMVKSGEISKEDARFHPKKNVVTRAISASCVVFPDMFEVKLTQDDIILICSDGLSNMMADDEIFDIVSANRESLKAAAESLIAKANENGGKDNISAVLFSL